MKIANENHGKFPSIFVKQKENTPRIFENKKNLRTREIAKPETGSDTDDCATSGPGKSLPKHKILRFLNELWVFSFHLTIFFQKSTEAFNCNMH